MTEQIYSHLPERICAALRGAHDGFGGVEEDVPNFCLRINGERVERAEALDYIDAWRKSGLWAFRGCP